MTNDRFREALTIDFSDMSIEDRKQLEVLMRIAGYNRVYDKEKDEMVKKNPTQKQLDGAWEHLKSNE